MEKRHQKYAWIIFFIFGLLWVIAAPINLGGRPPNPPSPEDATGLSLDQSAARRVPVREESRESAQVAGGIAGEPPAHRGPMAVGARIRHLGKWLGRRYESIGQVTLKRVLEDGQ